LVTLGILKEQNPYSELGQKTAWLSGEFKSAAESAGVALQTQAMGGMFGFFFSAEPVYNYQQALKTDTEQFTRFFRSMLKQGIYLPPSAFESLFVSTSHSEEDLERTAAAFRTALRGE
jgi:glutamate-1-semialdehyde 2,1-aminomutase